MSHKIFCSYRRTDADGHLNALFTALEERYGSGRVFRDRVSIEAGQDFRQALDGAITGCRVFLAIIGPQWADEVRRRSEGAGRDWVLAEIEAALAQPEITVIPVLIGGARMPPADLLTPAASELRARNAVSLYPEYWEEGVKALCRATDKVVTPSFKGMITRAAVEMEQLADLKQRPVVKATVRTMIELGDWLDHGVAQSNDFTPGDWVEAVTVTGFEDNKILAEGTLEERPVTARRVTCDKIAQAFRSQGIVRSGNLEQASLLCLALAEKCSEQAPVTPPGPDRTRYTRMAETLEREASECLAKIRK